MLIFQFIVHSEPIDSINDDFEGTEEAEAVDEEEEAGPSGLDVEDDGRILAVTIHRTDKLKNDFYIMHPMVRVHILDELTGKYLPKQHKYVFIITHYYLSDECLNRNRLCCHRMYRNCLKSYSCSH